jgi:hypothetical protein
MSHTTVIGSIIISDMDALNGAIRELKAQGVNCDLLQGVKARAYFDNQAGMENPDYTIKLHDSP